MIVPRLVDIWQVLLHEPRVAAIGEEMLQNAVRGQNLAEGNYLKSVDVERKRVKKVSGTNNLSGIKRNEKLKAAIKCSGNKINYIG